MIQALEEYRSHISSSLLNDRTKANVDRIIFWIGLDNERQDALYSLLHSENKVVVSRVSWVVGNYAQLYPNGLNKYVPDLIEYIFNSPSTKFVGVLRNLLKALEYNEADEENAGLLYDYCLKVSTSLSYELACRAYAITILVNIALVYKELIPEVLDVLDILKPDESPAIQARIKQGLKKLKKHQAD